MVEYNLPNKYFKISLFQDMWLIFNFASYKITWRWTALK